MGRSRRPGLVAILVVVALLAVVLGAWAFDSSRTGSGVARRVTLAGRDVGGETAQELTKTVNDLATGYDRAAVTIRTPGGTLETTAAAVGLHLDPDRTAQGALAVDRDTATPLRPVRWVASLAGSRSAPLAFQVDRSALIAGIATLDAANRSAPTEPGITAGDQGVTAVPGVPGKALDPDELSRRLQAAAATGVTPVVVDLQPSAVAPRFTDADARALAEKANALTHSPLTLDVAGKSATVQAKTVRSWLTAVAGTGGLELGVDEAKVEHDLAPLVGDLGTAPVDATFTVAEGPNGAPGAVSIVDGKAGTRCCAPDSIPRILQALTSGQTTATLDVVASPPAHDRAWAEKLQIGEPIASFTTKHPAGQPRVVNIHRIADLARGMVIEPGQTFSVNERIGQRTAEKGFVDAGVIYEGKHTTDIGGGVSQFATTLFNAAFFGGLDLVDYQSHSEFIDRYPYGREATISWPKPDLKIHNNTPYGVLIWTSYTDTSLTITLYSTKFVSGDQTGQTKQPGDPCDKIITERTRTYLDGHQDKDNVVAYYAHVSDAGVTCW